MTVSLAPISLPVSIDASAGTNTDCLPTDLLDFIPLTPVPLSPISPPSSSSVESSPLISPLSKRFKLSSLGSERLVAAQELIDATPSSSISVLSPQQLQKKFIRWASVLRLIKRSRLQRDKVVQQWGSAQEIFPRLYISNWYVAASKTTLNSLSITHVVKIGEQYRTSQHHSNRVYLSIELDDTESTELSPHFLPFFKFVNEALAENTTNRVLVHCEAGISRSVSLSIAWLMSVHTMTYQSAFERINAVRCFVNPNMGFVTQLHRYQSDILLPDISTAHQEENSLLPFVFNSTPSEPNEVNAEAVSDLHQKRNRDGSTRVPPHARRSLHFNAITKEQTE